MKKIFTFFLFAATVFTFQACKDDSEETLSVDQLKVLAIKNYGDIVYATYDDSYKTAVTLKEKIDAFVAAPSAQKLADAKAAWKAARIPYGQTEAFRFYGGPIDDEDGPEGLINAWPIDESYIDYVDGNEGGGIVNTPAITITKENLADLNEQGGEANIATGYHAIEFLLWGQDAPDNDTTGLRAYTDYITGEGSTAENADRRGQYLKVVTELLTDNLKEVRDQWLETGAYRIAFEDAASGATYGNIFTGMGELAKGELAGERMLVAAESGDQENEHSCFSDNTKVDILMNFKSVQNVYMGSYERVDGSVVAGVSINEIANRLDATKNAAVINAFTEAEAKINAIAGRFDKAIANTPEKIEAAAVVLQGLGDKISDVALTLGADL